MSTLKGLGTIANGWIKFVVALVAIGWFGLTAVDKFSKESELDSNELVKSQDSNNKEVSPLFTSTVETTDNTSNDASAHKTKELRETPVSLIAKDLKTGASSIFSMRSTQLIIALIVGLVAGMIGRPGFDWLKEKREIAKAKKFMRLQKWAEEKLAESNEIRETPDEISNSISSSSLSSGPRV